MSLFSTLQIASNALQANQVGLQVVGQNIANDNTPGYSREVVNYLPSPTQQIGAISLGTGVEVQGVVQVVDQYLEERLRGANSDVANSSTQSQTYKNLESVVGALQSNSIDSAMNTFFSSISGILNQPESTSARNLAVLQGQTLASNIGNVATRVIQARNDLNSQVVGLTTSINQLVTQIASLNTRIVATEGGNSQVSQAVGLRDQRAEDLTQLSNLVGVTVQQQADGSDNVFVGGEYLVFEGTARQVQTIYSQDTNGLTAANVSVVGDNSPLKAQSGQLAGLLASRDTILGGYLDQLNQFAGTLAFEFNKVFSQGQGLTGYTSVTSTTPVTSATAPLDAAGLPFTPVNGSFQIQTLNQKTGATSTTTIQVDLNGLDKNETSLNSIASQISAVNGLTASVSPNGNLTISSTSPDVQFSFANDTSGALAALGVNTFFTGSLATDLGVNSALVDNPGAFAASTQGIGSDTSNAQTLANFINQPLASQNGLSVGQLNDQIVSDVTQGSAVAQSMATGDSTFQQTLLGQETATSGVSIDQEATEMIQLQTTYQASAKLIATINSLLNTLMNIPL
ncbi:MAG TPA: flagellar hook-associated protein FlgK [Pirellulales bacterium]|nr:flagellar hook-associated protein FlgK [Pirellulales bacterium]